MLEVGVQRRGPQLQAKQGGGLGLLPVGELAAPDLPERVFVLWHHFLAVSLDSLDALLLNSVLPAGAGSAVGEDVGGNGGGPENVEIVNLAQQVLHMLEIVAPGRVLLGQEVFDDVAKAFDADTKPVKCGRGGAAHGLAVEPVGFGPALEGEMTKDQTTRPEPCHPAGQRTSPALPLLAVEL